MKRAVQEAGNPTFANILASGLAGNLSANGLAELGTCTVAMMVFLWIKRRWLKVGLLQLLC